MVFERLGLSLYDLIKKRDYKGLPIAMVKSISRSVGLGCPVLASEANLCDLLS